MVFDRVTVLLLGLNVCCCFIAAIIAIALRCVGLTLPILHDVLQELKALEQFLDVGKMRMLELVDDTAEAHETLDTLVRNGGWLV